jgi:hypothetical protein
MLIALASTWIRTIDLQPSATANATNHTGALLVSLLSGPFRGKQVTSVWHQHAGQDDLAVWQELLKATVLRFRAKRVGSNMGVLESLAGHLGDFLEQGEKTRWVPCTDRGSGDGRFRLIGPALQKSRFPAWLQPHPGYPSSQPSTTTLRTSSTRTTSPLTSSPSFPTRLSSRTPSTRRSRLPRAATVFHPRSES